MVVLNISDCGKSGYDKILIHSFPKKKKITRVFVIVTYPENLLASVFKD